MPKGTIRDISELHPVMQPRVRQWMANVKALGYPMQIIETRRTMAVAAAYYAQGRQRIDHVNEIRLKAGLDKLPANENRIITRAKPGLSWHIYGLAVDFVPLVDGKLDWIHDGEKPDDLFDEIAMEAQKLHMQWGGAWRTFRDSPHIEYHPGWAVRDALAWMKQHKNWRIPLG